MRTSFAGRFHAFGILVAVALLVATFAPNAAVAQNWRDRAAPTEPAATETALFPIDEEEPDATAIDMAGAFVSEELGYSIEWNADWEEVPDDRNFRDDADWFPTEILVLDWTQASFWSRLSIDGYPAGDGTVQDDHEWWTSPEWYTTVFGSDLTVEPLLDGLTSTSAGVLFVVSQTASGEPIGFMLMQSIELPNGNAVLVEFTVETVDDYEEVWRSAHEGVLLDGEPLLSFFEWDELEEAMDEWGV